MDADDISRLRRVVGKLARELNTSATAEGLTPTQASVLGLVAAHGSLSLAELVDLEGLNPTMLSRVVRKLSDSGLVRRVPDPNDLRSASVESTARGDDTHRRLRERRTAIVSDCAAGLDPAETADLVRALPALEALVQQLAVRRATTWVG